MVGGAAKTFVSGTDAGGWLTGVAHRPDLWMSIEPANRLPGVSPSRNGRVAIWPNVYPEGGTIRMVPGKSGTRKVIGYPGMPSTLPMIDVGVAPGCTVTSNGRQLFFMSPDGDEYLHTTPAFGWWGTDRLKDASTTDGAGVGDLDLIAVGSSERGGIIYSRFRLQPDPVSWAGSSGVVRFDPSTELSGTSDTDVTHVIEGQADYNYGGAVQNEVQDQEFIFGKRHALLKGDESLYPAGTYTDCSWDLFWNTTGGVTGELSFHQMDPNNAGWIQGASSGWRVTGEPTWNHFEWHATTPTFWYNGGLGLVSGTDYTATAYLTQVHTLGTHDNQYNSHSLAPSWFEAARDTPADNAGVFVKQLTLTGLHGFPGTSEVNNPLLTITYTVGGGGASPYYFDGLLRNRRR